MMADNSNHIARLSAYVDRELDTEAEAAVAIEIAHERNAAQIVANFAAAKSGVRQAFAIDESCPEVLPRAPRLSLFFKVAAALVMGIGVTVFLYGRISATKNDDLLVLALDHHSRWQSSVSFPARYPAIAAIVVPDLAPAGLTPVSVEPTVQLGKVTASHVTYLGKRGCRLSLYAFAQAALPGQLAEMPDEHALTAQWTAGRLEYLLVAQKMNAERFAVLTGAMKEATLNAVPPAAKTQVAMQNARQPCQA